MAWRALIAALIALAIIVPLTVTNGMRFSLWTNLFFLWPSLHAMNTFLWSESIVLLLTFIASTIHHGCVHNDAMRTSLSLETFLILAIGWLAFVGGALVSNLYDGGVQDNKSRRANVLIVVGTLGLLIGLGVLVVGLALAPSTINACFVAPTNLVASHALADAWGTIDFATALAALILIILYVLQVNRSRIELGIFWLLIIANSILAAYRDYAHSWSTDELYLIMACIALVGLAGRALGGWTSCTMRERAHARAAFHWRDALLGALVGAVALLIFVAINQSETSSIHGWWHVLGSLAIYVLLDAVRHE